jgi:hypothetical protein
VWLSRADSLNRSTPKFLTPWSIVGLAVLAHFDGLSPSREPPKSELLFDHNCLTRAWLRGQHTDSPKIHQASLAENRSKIAIAAASPGV